MEKMTGVDKVGYFDIRYHSSSAYSYSIYPRLRFTFKVNARHDSLVLNNLKLKLMMETKDGQTFHIGYLIPEDPLTLIYPGSATTLLMDLELDHYKLHQIEKLRSGDLKLIIDGKFTLEREDQPQSRGVGNLDTFRFTISKSDWIEKHLTALGYKNVSLIEIPKLDERYSEIIEHLNEAWKQHSMGRPKNVLTECRRALEVLSNEVKKKGFKTKDEKKVIPDWPKLFNDKDTGNILGAINQKMFGFLGPGGHSGGTINREYGEFALLVTQGIVSLVTSKLLEE